MRVSYLIKAVLPCVRHWDGCLDQRETVGGWLGRGDLSHPEQCSLLRPNFGSRGLGTSCSDRSRGDAVFAENVAIARRKGATGSCPRESGAHRIEAFFRLFFCLNKKMNSPGKGEILTLQDGTAKTARLRALKRWGRASLAGRAGRSNSPYTPYELLRGCFASPATYFCFKANKSRQKTPFIDRHSRARFLLDQGCSAVRPPLGRMP